MKNQSELYLEKLQTKAKEMKAQLLGNDLKKIYAQLEGKAVDEQIELRKKLSEIEEKNNKLETKISEAQQKAKAKASDTKEAAEQSWEEIKTSLENTWEDIESSWERLKEKVTA